MELLDKYKLHEEELAEALKDPKNLDKMLSKYGISGADSADIAKELNTMVTNGLDSGDLKVYAAVEVNDLLTKHNIPADVVQEAIALYTAGKMEDLQKLAAEHNVSPEAFNEIKTGLESLAKNG